MRRLQPILATLAISVLAGPALSEGPATVRVDDSSLPWNRAFTVRDETREEDRTFLPLRSPGVDIPATNKWGVTVNFDLKETSFENTERMRAGAYFDLSPRIRLGGSLSFSAPGDLRISTPSDRGLPSAPSEYEQSVRIESSIKF